MESSDRILVIDDELGIRQGCRRVLEPEGFVVETAATGKEGLERIRERSFDLVLLDVVMPDVRGIELLEPIHQQDPETIVIVITGYATVELAVEAIKAGAYDFLSKPFTSDVLLVTVRQGLERRRLLQEARRAQAAEQRAAELERLDRFKTQFTLTVAHELRAPLTALQSFLIAVLKGYIPADEQKKVLQRAIDRSQELLDMVDDLLKLAAAKAEQETATRQRVPLDEVLEKISSLQKAQADEKGIDYRVNEAQHVQVHADRDQMGQLWTNLISNAIKYTPPGGKVTVTLTAEDGWAVGSVADTGIGIAPEDQGRIFEEFYRTAKAKQIEARGTGLGLPLVKRIVEGHGGTLEVNSTPGEGSRFTFRLPLAGEEENSTP